MCVGPGEGGGASPCRQVHDPELGVSKMGIQHMVDCEYY